MAENRQRVPFKPQVSAAGLTRFPSQIKWEDPCEAGLDLHKLRAKEAQLRRPLELLTHPARPERRDEAWVRDRFKLPHRSQIGADLDGVAMNQDMGERLAKDFELIALWHRAGELRAAAGLRRDNLVKQVKEIAKLAARLADSLGPNSSEIEAWMAALPDTDVADHHNLIRLADDAREVSASLTSALASSRRTGRSRDSRRNIALVLAIQAAEEATGVKAVIKRQDAWETSRFTSVSGMIASRYVCWLTGAAEPHLVVAFEKLRRLPRKNAEKK